MRVWRREEDFDLPSCVVALGTFDGVHIGHQALIRRAMELARKYGVSSTVIALAYIMGHPLNPSAMCTYTKIEQYEDSIRALDIRLAPEEIEYLEKG